MLYQYSELNVYKTSSKAIKAQKAVKSLPQVKFSKAEQQVILAHNSKSINYHGQGYAIVAEDAGYYYCVSEAYKEEMSNSIAVMAMQTTDSLATDKAEEEWSFSQTEEGDSTKAIIQMPTWELFSIVLKLLPDIQPRLK
jgi:hypothetical protein